MTNPASKPARKSFQLHLPPELHRRLKVLAAQRGTTITELILQAVEQVFPENGASPA